ncbi:MAG: bifunctional YncE family protein/alkaline phosphatase family protein [Gemmatimonadetes bacterium]|nr:bifunctional YncE family protein/alkaline phosphatase family protein [Gemmatimonadota bacterium]
MRALGSMPLTMIPSPNAQQFVLLMNGSLQQGVQVVDRRTGQVTHTLAQPAAFLGLAFSPDGHALFASGGNQDVVYRYAWWDGVPVLTDSLVLAIKPTDRNGTRYPAGLAVSRDGDRLYVAENLADSLAVIDLATGQVVQRLATERYPVGVVVGSDGTVFVSAWGGNTLSIFPRDAQGRLETGTRLSVGRHPSTLLLNADSSRLFVASASTDRVIVVDPRARSVLATLHDPPPSGPGEGATPSGFTLSRDGTRLFVAESDANAVGIFDLSARTSGVAAATGRDSLVGRIPAQWYPTAILASRDTLWVVNGKGRGTGPNRLLPRLNLPSTARDTVDGGRQYTLGQLSGTLMIAPLARTIGAELAALTQRVTRANGWDRPRTARAPFTYPPITHVLYVVKENRTYDQVFGDLPQGDGDSSLTFFPRPHSPNHHALAERFGLYDRFFVNAEVSPDGHEWSMAAYVTDYAGRTIPSNYSRRGRTYDYEGTNRNAILADDDDDVAGPASGYLWNLAQAAGISFRNFGEFAIPAGGFGSTRGGSYVGLKKFQRDHTSPAYPPYNLMIPDQRRADAWLAEFAQWEKDGTMPRLQVLRLPNDHTSYARPGAPTPYAYMADNDLALGRIVEALSKSRFWASTAVFVLEDDAQSGPDHVDSHRSVLLTISPWARGGTWHRFVNTTDVIATMEEILNLGSLSQFDHHGRPLREIWRDTPDLRPYALLTPVTPLTDVNPAAGPGVRESRGWDLSREDRVPDEAGQRVLWAMLKPGTPYPGSRRAPALEFTRAR